MSEPALSAFSMGPSGPQEEIYTWTFQGAPIRIDVRISVIAKLQSALVGYDQETTEIGGLLIGRTKPPGTLEIIDCIFLPSVGSSPEYTLDLAETERVRRWKRDPASPEGPAIVAGYFRTQRDPGLSLRDSEVGLFLQHFRDPSNVALLIHAAGEPGTAGFVFWDGGSLVPFSLLDFPLDAAALKQEEAALPTESASDWPAPAPKPQMLPPATPAAVLRASDTPAPDALVQNKGGRWLVWVASVVLLSLPLLVFAIRNQWFAPARVASPAPQTSPPAAPSLQLQVEALGNGLNLRWAPDAPAFAQASSGRLVILDGNAEQRTVDLDAAQLKIGHVYYRPSAEQVQIRLEVLKDGLVVAEASVLVLNSGAGAGQQTQAKPARPASGPPANDLKVIPIPDAGIKQVPVPSAPESTPLPSVTPVEQPQFETRQSIREVTAIREPAEALTAPSALVMGRTESLAPAPAALPAFEPPPVAAPANTTAPRPAVPVYVAPAPIRQASPNMTSDMRSAISLGEGKLVVPVRVVIDATGKVVRADPVSLQAVAGPKTDYLRAAAVGAARQWQFRAATLNGVSIPSEFIIEFRFR